MELYQIRNFAAIVDTGSFTKAAARSCVSQPALSASIAKLEDELGTVLFYRGSKGISLSAAGKRFLTTAREVLTSCDKVKSELRSTAVRRSLRIGVLRTLPTLQLVSYLDSFRQANPEFSFELFDGACDELQVKLLERKLIACVTSAGDASPEQRSQVLQHERYVLAVDPGHRLANQETACLKDLNGERFIVRSHCETYASTSRVFVEQGIKTHVVFKTDQDDRALALIAAGFGVALMPSGHCAAGVRKIPLRDFDVERTIELRWNTDTEDEDLKKLILYSRTQKVGLMAD
ncbi:LysR family transcriptional regulator [Methylobacterium sp. WL64]|uniref:LysR family transcriptional regulator n=1 Tax=Methylobacterium sp. WL64 TaxID=2603894 RepID=UPI00164F7BCA|nr:LysR family transcriptional regulator [Methylobacterium sp. WL64]